MSATTRHMRLDGLLSTTAHDHPERPAITDGDRTIGYAELERSVNDVADALAAAGVRPGDRVGVYMRKSLDAVTALYAVLRIGGVAAPLDVIDPPERTARIARNAGLEFLITSPQTEQAATGIAKRVGVGHAHATLVGPVLSLLALADSGPAPPLAAEGGYLLFTSGSTGRPKGVLLSHRNVLHFVSWAVDEFGVGPSDRIGSQAALTFDLSTFDIFGSAMVGACLCIMPEMFKAFPRDAVRWLNEERISILYAVPTLYRAMLDRGGITNTPPTGLRIIAFAGEPFPSGTLQRYIDAFDAASFYNLYGPTETNVCTCEKMPRNWSAAEGLSIGRPISGMRIELVDDEGRATSREGEIAIAGPSVFLGYLVDGELREHTTHIVFNDGTAGQAYLSGDLARYGPDGRLYLRGRRDHQVKRRGHRIELPEIESVVHELSGVHSCAAVWKPDASADGEIWLFVVTHGATREQVARAILSVLPWNMAPDCIEIVDELPVNGRGKIDREILASRPIDQGVAPWTRSTTSAR